jgi:hypothetical protein
MHQLRAILPRVNTRLPLAAWSTRKEMVRCQPMPSIRTRRMVISSKASLFTSSVRSPHTYKNQNVTADRLSQKAKLTTHSPAMTICIVPVFSFTRNMTDRRTDTLVGVEEGIIEDTRTNRFMALDFSRRILPTQVAVIFSCLSRDIPYCERHRGKAWC